MRGRGPSVRDVVVVESVLLEVLIGILLILMGAVMIYDSIRTILTYIAWKRDGGTLRIHSGKHTLVFRRKPGP
jgi:hypothetical protein